jgi:hypothetical protein
MRAKTTLMTARRAISNEEFIAKYREWLSPWKLTEGEPREKDSSKLPEGEIEDVVSYLCRLAKRIAPVPVSKATKAVRQDFAREEQMRACEEHQRSREGRVKNIMKILRAVIALDRFFADLEGAESQARGISEQRLRHRSWRRYNTP